MPSPYNNEWMRARLGNNRKLESVVLKAGQKEDIIADLDRFFASHDRYEALGIPWRRGYLLFGPPGTGKTSLVKRWLERIKADGWRGARRVYGWSFYSQGTRDQLAASSDLFLKEALTFFGDDADKARWVPVSEALARLQAARLRSTPVRVTGSGPRSKGR